MLLGEFGLSILASWLANQIDKNNNEVEKVEHIEEKDKIPTEEILKQLFKTYDIYDELNDILDYLDNPIAHILVETSPSNFYNLTTIVLESKTTNEWFVFNRGRTSFQGTGGGIRQSKDVIKKFQDKKIKIGTWAIDRNLLNDFESGKILWQNIKHEIIPLMASHVNQSDWQIIQDGAKKILDT